MTDDWLSAMYNNEYCEVLFLDLCKAFDLVDHNILLKKLKLYQLCEQSLFWFQSYLSFTIWGQCNKTDIYSIIKLQKQAARLILDADKYSPSSPLFDQEKQATMIFKALNNLTPDYISNLFKATCTNTNHSLRSKTSNKLHVSAAHHKSLRFNGPKIWNSLSDKARKATTLKEFVREYKNGNKNS